MKKSLGPIPLVVVVPGLRVKRRSGFSGFAFCFALLALLLGCRDQPSAANSQKGQAQSPPERIVTLTPSASELVLALGARDRLVGIDRFSAELPGLDGLAVVGDFLDPSFEAIARLEPDLVIADALQDKVASGLRAAKLPTLSLPMHRLADVTRGLREVGAALGADAEAGAAVAALDEALAAARARASARSRRARVLVVLDRDPKTLGSMVAAGHGSFADELLEVIGADNVLAGSSVRYPRISAEQILRGRPDVIIDSSPGARDSASAWATLAEVPAVAEGRVHASAERAWTTPSPRLSSALRELEAVVYGVESR